VGRASILILLLGAACARPAAPEAPAASPGPARPSAEAAKPRRVSLTVIGTSDLHGHLDRLPILAGYLAVLRGSVGADAIVLLDGGDMFQGTIESNMNEGAAVIEAYGRLGYTAAAIGNHEFDFGPVGERAVPAAGDDPRGALLARAGEARFPLLAANVLDAATGKRVDWPRLPASALVERAGVRVGVIGITTESTPRTTMSKNFAGLAIAPLAPTVAAEAAELRRRGADVVLVAAHAGGRCSKFDDPAVLDSCAPDQEIFQVARALPPGAVDVIVAGHTHAGVAHQVAGVAIVQSFANGVAFGRVDLVVEPGRGVVSRRIHPPRFMCGESARDGGPCEPGEYEGRAVVADAQVAALVARPIAAAEELRERRLGVSLEGPIRRAHREESALGNLFADLMRAARPGADVAITNGGGLRADLPAGELTYGALYKAMPFDNRFARVRLTGEQLTRVIAANMVSESGIFSLSGVRVEAACRGGELVVSLRRENGRRVRPRDRIVLVTSDFLASGGDQMLADIDLPDGAIEFEEGEPIRDAIAGALRARGGTAPGSPRTPWNQAIGRLFAGGTLRGDDRRLYDPRAPRIALPGPRPLRCR
jgi:2',3'-cyclic-nucleotide 2'-phosphodiesterase (5'-nucleotidase family)